jgi:CBS domain-containing protein
MFGSTSAADSGPVGDASTQRVIVMTLLEPVSTLAPPVPVTVGPEATIGDAIAVMNGISAGSVLVAESGRLLGIFTERDVLTKVVGQRDLTEPVTAAMTADPETIAPDDCIALLFNKIRLGGFRHLPVVDEDGAIAGMLSVREALSFAVSLFPEQVRGGQRPARDLYQTVALLYGHEAASEARQGFTALVGQPVAELQPKSPGHVAIGTSLAEAVQRMNALKTGSLLVRDGAETVGIVTERDILRRVVGQLPLDTPVDAVMTRSPRCVPQDASLDVALALMYEGRFRHLPVTGEDGQVSGIVSIRDFICFMAAIFAATVANVTERDLEY